MTQDKCFSEALLFPHPHTIPQAAQGLPGSLVLPRAAGVLSTGSDSDLQQPCFRRGRSELQNNLLTCLIAPIISVSVYTDRPKDRGNRGNREF